MPVTIPLVFVPPLSAWTEEMRRDADNGVPLDPIQAHLKLGILGFFCSLARELLAVRFVRPESGADSAADLFETADEWEAAPIGLGLGALEQAFLAHWPHRLRLPHNVRPLPSVVGPTAGGCVFVRPRTALHLHVPRRSVRDVPGHPLDAVRGGGAPR